MSLAPDLLSLLIACKDALEDDQPRLSLTDYLEEQATPIAPSWCAFRSPAFPSTAMSRTTANTRSASRNWPTSIARAGWGRCPGRSCLVSRSFRKMSDDGLPAGVSFTRENFR